MTLPSGFHLYQVNDLNMHGMIRCMHANIAHALLRLRLTTAMLALNLVILIQYIMYITAR
jgi:hypothetical protein